MDLPDGRSEPPAPRRSGAPRLAAQGELWAGAAPVSAPPPAAAASDGGVARFDYFLSEPDTTNNRMALRSAIAALDLAAPLGAARLAFVSDSAYVVRGMNEWVPAWKARGWRRKGGPIENLDLWRELDRRAEERRAAGRFLEWRWVRGHAGHPKNEYANLLATRAAAEQGASAGLVPSGFAAWLTAERERGRYLRFDPDGELR